MSKFQGLLNYFLSSFKGLGSKIADFGASSSTALLGSGYTPILASIGKAAIDLTRNALIDRVSGYIDEGHQALKSLKIGNTSDFTFKSGNKISSDNRDMSGIMLSGGQKAARHRLKKYYPHEPLGKRRKLEQRLIAEDSAKDLILEEKTFAKRGYEEEEEEDEE